MIAMEKNQSRFLLLVGHFKCIALYRVTAAVEVIHLNTMFRDITVMHQVNNSATNYYSAKVQSVVSM